MFSIEQSSLGNIGPTLPFRVVFGFHHLVGSEISMRRQVVSSAVADSIPLRIALGPRQWRLALKRSDMVHLRITDLQSALHSSLVVVKAGAGWLQ